MCALSYSEVSLELPFKLMHPKAEPGSPLPLPPLLILTSFTSYQITDLLSLSITFPHVLCELCLQPKQGEATLTSLAGFDYRLEFQISSGAA